ncbi:MAG TPA: hypothetical protein V6D10_07415 [Trichocoleus sp.]|jgi:hypothetical protein
MAKKFKIINEWQSFERAVMPKNASAVQRQEMRRAFYMGAVAMLNIMKRIGDDPLIDEEAGSAILDSIDAELKDFQSRIGIDV